MADQRLQIGVVGLGSVGIEVCRTLLVGIDGMALTVVASSSRQRAKAAMARLGTKTPVAEIRKIGEFCDVLVDCAVPAVLPQIASNALARGKTLITINSNAVLLNPAIMDLAQHSLGRIIVASGGILGLDGLRAANQGMLRSVKVTTRKPPEAFQAIQGTSGAALKEPRLIFAGSAMESALQFPNNTNVVASVALAGIGPEMTEMELWADPTISRNVHNVRASSDTADLEITIQNVPSDNPGTARIVALSVIATLKDLGSRVRIGA